MIDQYILDPIELLSRNRFDICAKYIYAKNKDTRSKFPREIYSHHLKVWNNHSEYNDPNKQDLDSFISEFDKILNSIKESGFDKEKSFIPVYNGCALNGAHRIAAALLHNKKVFCKESPITSGQVDCSYYFFKDRDCYEPGGLKQEYADEMALQYVKLKKNTFIVTIFPSAFGHDSSVERILKEFGSIVYNKEVHLNKVGPYNYIRTLYDGEWWLGNWNNMFAGAQTKTKECFKYPGPTRIYLIETNNTEKLVEAKRLIRQLYNIGNHSVHINDTHEETLRIAQSVFNKNSIHFLNSSNPAFLNNFENYFNKYREWLSANSFDKDDFCVDASAVLSVYGLRDCRDVDFLYLKDFIETGTEDYSCHNHEAKYYPIHKDEIVVNPLNHFYYKGVKFASPLIIKTMKQIRCEEKDMKDVQLLNNVLK